MVSLNRRDSKPLYHQIGDFLQSAIDNGELLPGNRLPSENEISSRYNVSRNTARLAINALIMRGLAYRVKGKGTFVTQSRIRYGLMQLTSFTEEMRRRGMSAASKVLSLVCETPPQKIARYLQIDSQTPAYKIERLRLANGEPMALHLSYVPCDLCPGLEQEDLSSDSLYDLLEIKHGLRIAYADQVLKPAIASQYEAELLTVYPGSPLLVVESVAFLDRGIPVEYARLIYRGDRYEFPFQSVRRREYADTSHRERLERMAVDSG